MSEKIKNILTFDVEDWRQAALDRNLPVSDRVLYNTNRLLDILGEEGARGTFFVQTKAAIEYPELIQRIRDEGHEVGTHGHAHVSLFEQSASEFAADLRLSLDILGEIVKEPIIAYRAPVFSLSKETWWALDVLRDHGIQYDSSVFPFKGKRYGIADSLVQPHGIADGVIEVPLCVISWLGRRWPVGGGGFFRLYPYTVTKWAIERVNKEGRPAVVYLHPYELDSDDLRQFKGQMSKRFYLSQTLNRGRTELRLRQLLQDFDFFPIGEVVKL